MKNHTTTAKYAQRLLIIALAALALLAGCGQMPSATTGSAPLANSIVRPQAAAPSATPAASLAPTEPPAATGLGAQPTGAVLLTCYKSGGIAGVSDTWTVYTTGRVTFQGRGATQLIQLEDAELAALRQLVTGPEFAALGGRYVTRGADLFGYELQIPGANGTLKTVELTMPSSHPAVLDQLIAALEGMRK